MAKTKRLERDWNENFTVGTIKHLATGEVLSFDLANFDGTTANLSETARRLLIHGWHQKVGDGIADTAKFANAAEEFDAMAAIHERLMEGTWTKDRESAGPRSNMVVEAVARAFAEAGREVDKAALIAKYTGKDAGDARKFAMTNEAVKRHYLAIQAERAAAAAAKAPAGPAASIDQL